MGIWKKIGKCAKVVGEVAFPRRAEAIRGVIRRPPLKDQPTAEPTRKVKAVGISGVVAALFVLLLGRLGVDVDSETATALAVAFVALVGYFTTSRDGE